MKIDKLQTLFENRSESLFYYHELNIIREIERSRIFDELYSDIEKKYNFKQITIHNHDYIFIYQLLDWDSNYFKFPVHKIKCILFKNSSIDLLSSAIKQFTKQLQLLNRSYIFTEIPSEDNIVLQAFCQIGYKVVETRLHHYLNTKGYNFQRFNARKAIKEDIPLLKKTASENSNKFDRIHSDSFFSTSEANNYMETYIENALNGFCDFVLVPNENKTPIKAFMAASILKQGNHRLGEKTIGRLQLAAVDPECKGWYLKLASESVYELIDRHAEFVIVTTQSTNRAAFHSSEKQGFKLGAVSHVLSY